MEPQAGTTSIASTVAIAITDIRMLVDVRIVWDLVYLNRKNAAHFFVGLGAKSGRRVAMEAALRSENLLFVVAAIAMMMSFQASRHLY
jgi:hypothetical protein